MNTDKLDKFISVFRVSLVRDENVHFDQTPVCSAPEAQRIIQKLISTLGQPDREQFCVILLNAKNKIIGMNIVSVGDLTHAVVHPAEIMSITVYEHLIINMENCNYYSFADNGLIQRMKHQVK